MFVILFERVRRGNPTERMLGLVLAVIQKEKIHRLQSAGLIPFHLLDFKVNLSVNHLISGYFTNIYYFSKITIFLFMLKLENYINF